MPAQARLAEKPSLTLKRRINAPPAKIFAAWTDPEKLAHWFGPADTVAGSASAELMSRSAAASASASPPQTASSMRSAASTAR